MPLKKNGGMSKNPALIINPSRSFKPPHLKYKRIFGMAFSKKWDIFFSQNNHFGPIVVKSLTKRSDLVWDRQINHQWLILPKVSKNKADNILSIMNPMVIKTVQERKKFFFSNEF